MSGLKTKRCPECGQKPIAQFPFGESVIVWCEDCCAADPYSKRSESLIGCGGTPREAINEWNARVETEEL